VSTDGSSKESVTVVDHRWRDLDEHVRRGRAWCCLELTAGNDHHRDRNIAQKLGCSRTEEHLGVVLPPRTYILISFIAAVVSIQRS
jgi:hypothetical protein